MKKIILGVLSAFTLNFAASAAESVKIGVLYPLTGPVAQVGKDAVSAVETAIDIINNSHDLDMPLAVILPSAAGLEKAKLAANGPDAMCPISEAHCSVARRDFSRRSRCAHTYATSQLDTLIKADPVVLALAYFPNLVEHRDIINQAVEGKVKALYFFEASHEHGPFLSQEDHSRLLEYHAFGVEVYWVCGLNQDLMTHTIRDGQRIALLGIGSGLFCTMLAVQW